MSSNHIKNVAIVGAGGNCGRPITEALLKTGKHTVTALTRPGSKSVLPEGVATREIDYDNVSSLVDALKGQDALIITMNVMAPKDQQAKLIEAAAEANVAWILPNEWGTDTQNETLSNESLLGPGRSEAQKHIAKLGKSSFIAVVTSFWYEWSLSIPTGYGFDLLNRSVTFFDQGETKMTTTTWPQVGRAVAALLSLPVSGNGEKCLEHYKNGHVYVKSFTLTQQDIFASVQRVTQTRAADWSIMHEPVKERWATAMESFKGGDYSAFGKVLYTRNFFEDEPGNTEKRYGVSNEALGLPVEDIDEATRAAVKRAQETGGKAY